VFCHSDRSDAKHHVVEESSLERQSPLQLPAGFLDFTRELQRVMCCFGFGRNADQRNGMVALDCGSDRGVGRDVHCESYGAVLDDDAVAVDLGVGVLFEVRMSTQRYFSLPKS